jgi:uncharacterized protein (TIGR00299 family) protein
VDSIVDITGAMLLMEHLGWPEIISSPVNVGSGTVECAHGVMPIPTPATTELLKGMKIFSAGDPVERTTPTGALLLRVLVGENGFRNLPEGVIMCAGIGLGSKDTRDIPNIIRATLFDAGGGASSRSFERDETLVIESNIDDMNPQDFSSVTEKLMASGALDVWRENILMKKNRQAVKLCCLCREEDAERFAMIMIRETTTLGVRISKVRRLFLSRSEQEVATSLGSIRLKKASFDGQIIRQIPEYEDLLRLSREKNIPLPELRRTIDKEI